jgi:hypothetical protein
MSRVKSKGRVSRPKRDPLRTAIEAVTPEMHEQIAREYRYLLAKLPPKRPPAHRCTAGAR